MPPAITITMPPIDIASYAPSQWHVATSNVDWDIFKGRVEVPSNIRTIAGNIKTWIASIAHKASAHIQIAIQGATTLLHQHPYTALAISTLISFPGAIFIPPLLFCAVCTPVLRLLGFCVGGIASGSIAAAIQSARYGAAVPAKGVFAMLQSLGATTGVSALVVLGSWLLIVPWLVSCAVWVYVVFGVLLR